MFRSPFVAIFREVFFQRYVTNTTKPITYLTTDTYRGAGKSLARPGRKQASDKTHNFCKPLKKKISRVSVQPGLRGSNDLRVGRKMATFQLCFHSGRAKDLSATL